MLNDEAKNGVRNIFFVIFHKKYCQFKNYHYLCNRKNAIKREKAAVR